MKFTNSVIIEHGTGNSVEKLKKGLTLLFHDGNENFEIIDAFENVYDSFINSYMQGHININMLICKIINILEINNHISKDCHLEFHHMKNRECKISLTF